MDNRKLAIITFSPTGGTLKCAEALAAGIGAVDRIIDLTKRDAKSYNLSSEEAAIIAVPSYGGRVPALAAERIKNIDANGASILSLAFLFSGFNIFTSSYFTALDKPAQSLVIAACRGLVFLCIGIVLLPMRFGLNGVWLAAPCAETLTFGISLFLMKHSRKMLLQ